MGFIDNIGKAIDIVKKSLASIRKDKSLLIPPILSAVFGCFFFVMAGIFYFFSRYSPVLAIGSLVFVFLAFLSNTIFAGALSWMAYEVHKGKDTTIASGLNRAMSRLGSLVAFASVSFLINIVAGQVRERSEERRSPVVVMLGMLFADLIEKGWSIVGALVLPVIMIEGKGFRDAFSEVQHRVGLQYLRYWYLADVKTTKEMTKNL